MSMDQIVYFFLALGMFVGYFAGKLRGEIKQQDLWRNHMEKSSRYMQAVDDLDKWCGHCSPHARLNARHLKAQGEGEGCNSGTPVGDEPCTISGLREQLKRLSQEARVPLSAEQQRCIAEAHNVAACEEYFNARPQIDYIANRRIFEAGFSKGYGITAAQKETP